MYVIQNSLLTDSPIMLINTHIGYDADDGYGVIGAEFERELLELDNNDQYKCIQVWINSPGGSVDDGYSIYNAILRTKTPVDTINVGIAASIAGVIFQAGRKRIMSDYSRLMYHDPSGTTNKDILDAYKDSLATMISSRSNKPKEEILNMMSKTTWINPSEALSSGLCDSIEYSGDKNKKHGNMKALWKAGNEIVNSILKTETTMADNVQAKVIGLSLVANYLGLNSEATENAVLEEVKNRLNKATLEKGKLEEDLTSVRNKLTKAEGDLSIANETIKTKDDEITKLKNDAKAEKEAAEKKVKEAENAQKLEKAKAMVTNHAKLGKIKNEQAVIDSWTKKAFDPEKGIDDFEGVDNMLKELPVNKVANKIITENNGADGKPLETGMNADALMANIQNNLKKQKS